MRMLRAWTAPAASTSRDPQAMEYGQSLAQPQNAVSLFSRSWNCKPILKHWLWEDTQFGVWALLSSPVEPSGTCLVGGILVDDADVLAVREPQESEVLGSLQVVLEVIEDLQQPEKQWLVGDCPQPGPGIPEAGGGGTLEGSQ